MAGTYNALATLCATDRMITTLGVRGQIVGEYVTALLAGDVLNSARPTLTTIPPPRIIDRVVRHSQLTGKRSSRHIVRSGDNRPALRIGEHHGRHGVLSGERIGMRKQGSQRVKERAHSRIIGMDCPRWDGERRNVRIPGLDKHSHDPSMSRSNQNRRFTWTVTPPTLPVPAIDPSN